jgi:ribonuclease D
MNGSFLDTSSFNFLTFPGQIHQITSDDQLSLLTEQLQTITELGFDTETRPSFKKGEVYQVALLQLSTETDAYLIRLHNIKNFSLFRTLFESQQVVKAGVAIRDDLKQLQKRFQFTPSRFVELQDLAKSKGLKNFGLKGMAEEVLGATITKGPKTTNWEASELTDRQLVYAATDAWIGLKLYQKLK